MQFPNIQKIQLVGFSDQLDFCVCQKIGLYQTYGSTVFLQKVITNK